MGWMQRFRSCRPSLLQLKANVKQHTADRAATKEAIAEATAIREKEAATFAIVSYDFKINIAAMTRQLQHWKRVLGFLRTNTVSSTRLHGITKFHMKT